MMAPRHGCRCVGLLLVLLLFLPAARAQPGVEEAAGEWLSRSIRLMREEQYPEAIPLLTHLITRAPTSKPGIEAQYRLGQCHAYLHQYAQAAAALEAFLARYPAGTFRGPALVLCCETSWQAGQWEAGDHPWKMLLDEWPEPVRCWKLIALEYQLRLQADPQGLARWLQHVPTFADLPPGTTAREALVWLYAIERVEAARSLAEGTRAIARCADGTCLLGGSFAFLVAARLYPVLFRQQQFAAAIALYRQTYDVISSRPDATRLHALHQQTYEDTLATAAPQAYVTQTPPQLTTALEQTKTADEAVTITPCLARFYTLAMQQGFLQEAYQMHRTAQASLQRFPESTLAADDRACFAAAVPEAAVTCLCTRAKQLLARGKREEALRELALLQAIAPTHPAVTALAALLAEEAR